MGVNSVSSSMQVAVNKNDYLKKSSSKTNRPFSREMTDVVNWRDKNFGFKVYTQATLQRLASVVNMAADELGVDLNTIDASPEATANRIADFAIGMFSIYKKQNPDMSEEEALGKYEKYIKRAIDKGFSEALKILDGLNVTDEETMAGIQTTYDLIQQKLDNFFQQRTEAAQNQTDVVADQV